MKNRKKVVLDLDHRCVAGSPQTRSCLVDFQGHCMSLAHLHARHNPLGLKYSTLWSRVVRGWDPGKAVKRPLQRSVA